MLDLFRLRAIVSREPGHSSRPTLAGRLGLKVFRTPGWDGALGLGRAVFGAFVYGVEDFSQGAGGGLRFGGQ